MSDMSGGPYLDPRTKINAMQRWPPSKLMAKLWACSRPGRDTTSAARLQPREPNLARLGSIPCIMTRFLIFNQVNSFIKLYYMGLS